MNFKVDAAPMNCIVDGIQDNFPLIVLLNVFCCWPSNKPPDDDRQEDGLVNNDFPAYILLMVLK